MKTCNTCNKEKEDIEFHKRSDSNGLRASCISCVKETRRKACVSCGHSFLPNGRHADRCTECYPFYRQAVNLVESARYRSTKKNIPFDITVSWVEERLRQPCPRTGFTYDILNKGSDFSNRSPYGPSLDKINPSLGYTTDNVQVVCWWYNCAKQRFSDEEVLQLCKAIVNRASS